MYDNMKNYSYGENAIRFAHGLIYNDIIVNDIVPVDIDSFSKMTLNDLILVNADCAHTDGMGLTRPTSIVFQNKAFVLMHDYLGTMYHHGQHLFSPTEQSDGGGCCLTFTMSGSDEVGCTQYLGHTDKYCDTFILKCNSHKYIGDFTIDAPGWKDFLNETFSHDIVVNFDNYFMKKICYS